MPREPREPGSPKDSSPRKDRLIQTRVPRSLEHTLKTEAARRRLSVSHLIRNVLEDTFTLVGNVVSEVDHLVGTSADLASQVVRDAGKIAQSAMGAGADDEPLDETDREPEPSEILAWNRVVLNREAQCTGCGASLAKGEEAHLGIRQVPGEPAWLCARCLAQL